MDDEDDALAAGSNGCDELGFFRRGGERPVLIVGNYCHDTIVTRSSRAHTLGGSAGYIAAVLDALGVESAVVAKVGPDFAYASRVSSHSPSIVAGAATTRFVADYTNADEDRLLRAESVCDPILAADLGNGGGDGGGVRYGIGLAAGVAGEILPETLERIVALCETVIVDIQALIRVIDPGTGVIECRKVEETGFAAMLGRVSVVKAARSEAKYIDVESARKKTCVIVTNGDKGSTVYTKTREYHVPAFPATEVDPTGAGDCFLGGFAAGLHRGLSIEKAVVVGNYFGAVAVSCMGIPTLNQFKECDQLFDGCHS